MSGKPCRKLGYMLAFQLELEPGSGWGCKDALLSKLLFCRNTLDVCFGCSLMSFRSSAVLTMTLF